MKSTAGYTGSVDVPEELDRAMRECLKSAHPLDQDLEFNVIEFINSRFPDANSLEGVQEYSRVLRDELDALNDEIPDLIRGHARASMKGKDDLDLAREAIVELNSRVNSIKERAEESEKTVTAVSRDIMLLDTAKKNVTLTVSTLKRLVMMVNACEQLAELASSREYSRTPALIMSIKDLETAFDDIKHIPRIDELLKHKNRIFTDLKLQIMEDYDLRILLTFPRPTLDTGSGPRILSSKEDVDKIDFNGAAQAVDALGDDVRQEIINKYCLMVMEEYTKQFAPPNGQLASLEFYEKRMQWLTKTLKDFTDKHGHLFPVEWIVNGELCMHFCHETRQHFIDVLSAPLAVALTKPANNSPQLPQGDATVPKVDPAELMVTVLIKCIELENDMQRRFDKVRTKLGLPEKDHFHFKGVITSCFEPYLKDWVAYEDKHMLALVKNFKASGHAGDELMGDAVQLEHIDTPETNRNVSDSVETDPPMVYTSCVTLFARMRSALQRCHQFTTGKVMADLFNLFRKIIDIYLDSVLSARLPTAKQIANENEESVKTACSVIGSLDYCLKMAPHLHKNCMAILDREFSVSIGREIQTIADTRDTAQDTLIMCVCGGEVRNAIVSASHLDWWGCELALGVSAHITKLKFALEKTAKILSKSLAESHSRGIIELVAERIASSIAESIYSAKPIGEAGAQQLLVDVGQVRAILLDFPAQVFPNKRVQDLYVQTVSRSLHKLEYSMKALSSPACSDRVSLRAMLDSLDPDLAQTGPGILDQEVDRLLSLRKGATSSATVHAMGNVSAMFGGTNLDSYFVDRSPSARFSSNLDNSPTSAQGNPQGTSRKTDLKSDLTKLGASLMKSKTFWKPQ